MSILKNKYTSKKTGKTKTQFYANVNYTEEDRRIIGPMRSSEKAAKKDEVDIIREIEANRAPVPRARKSVKINEIYHLWHEATEPPVYANSTWKVYEQFYNNYVRDIFGEKSVGYVTGTHIQNYVNIIKKKYSPEVVNKCINLLTNIFNFSIDPLKCSSVNPVSGIKRCQVPRKKKVTWDDEMISYFLELQEVKQAHYYPMLLLSALLGARPGEVCGLHESCLREKPTYSIVFDRGYDNWEEETDLKTKKSHRQPPIPKYLYDIIHKQVIWKRKKNMADLSWSQNDYLFVSQNGTPIKPRQYGKAFTRLLTAHNRRMEEYRNEHGRLPKDCHILPEITLYGFRASFATNNMRRCPNASLISSVMGNSPKTLMEFYAQPEMDMQKELVTSYASGKVERTIS